MQITKNLSDETLLIVIDGRIDTTTAPALEKELKQSITGEIKELVLDFEKVEYMSSAGIRVIMAADKVMSRQGGMKLVNVSEEIYDVFEMTGLVDFLTIE